MPNQKYYVRFRLLDAIVPAAAFSEWIGPIFALGPYVAAKQIVLEEDWPTLPCVVRAEVYDDIEDYRYDLCLSERCVKIVSSYVVMTEQKA